MSLDDFNKDKNDPESSLIQQFSCMSTENKEDLIKEFQRLLAPNDVSPEDCAFFLSMSNWNLQNAICCFFDYDAHKLLQQPLPECDLITDVTLAEGEAVAPRTTFIKTWRIANSGTTEWPSGCFLAFCSGDRMTTLERVIVESLKPGETTDVSVQMTSPSEPGVYQSRWRMVSNIGHYFGNEIWCIVTVTEGLGGLTEQMSSFNPLGSSANKPNVASSTDNPFGDHSPHTHSTNLNYQQPSIQIPHQFIQPADMPNPNIQRDAEMQSDEDNPNR